jgi:hypothetical protein
MNEMNPDKNCDRKRPWTSTCLHKGVFRLVPASFALAIALAAYLGYVRFGGPAKAAEGVEPTAAIEKRVANAPLPQATPQDHRGLHVVVFTLYREGLEPSVVHTTKGPVAILISDHTEGTPALVVERDNGSGGFVGAGQVNRFPQTKRGRAELSLEPGRYRVSDAGHPSNEAEIIVDP